MFSKTVLLSALAATVSAQKYFITFGDSYSMTYFDPAGTAPSTSNPIGNPAFPGYTTSGGLNWIDYLIAEKNDTLVYAFNYAYGGATVDSDIVAPYDTTVLSIIDQVQQFSDSIADKPANATWTADNSLFGIWIGINDVGMSWWLEDAADIRQQVYDALFEQVDILYNYGARNFVFLNIPPTDRSPYAVSLGDYTVQYLGEAIAAWNSEIGGEITSWASSKSGVTTTLVDTQEPFNTILDAGGDAADCYNEDGVTCLWYNDYHPGIEIHEAVADAVIDAGIDFF